jgi:hypothetical protein
MALGDNTNPMAGGMGARRARMITVAVAAEMVYQLVGSNMSSPQTAELNAKARANTIDKWVNITNVEASAWILFLSWMDGSLWPLFGGGLALGGMYVKYKYAIDSGLKSGEPGTENYKNPNGKVATPARVR